MGCNRIKSMSFSTLLIFIVTIKSSLAYSVISQYPKPERSFETKAPENGINENTIDEDFEPETEIQGHEPEDEFNGVYSECVMHLSFVCIQNKTLNYLKTLNEKTEIPIYGNYLKFVKTKKLLPENNTKIFYVATNPADEIDRKIDEFFGTHVIRVQYGKEFEEDIDIGKMMETTEGRKKEKEDKNKKMMMMAMMMMKMKMMMMVPAMMGMTGIIAFKALILGAISLLISKILLIMKLMMMGGGGGKMGGQGSGHGADVTVWMPSGGSGGGMGGWDSHGSSGGGGGGYNANGEWQNRAGWEAPQILRGVRADRKKRTIEYGREDKALNQIVKGDGSVDDEKHRDALNQLFLKIGNVIARETKYIQRI